jgi:FkbM family methyltransferase
MKSNGWFLPQVPLTDRMVALFYRRGWRGATWLHRNIKHGKRILARATNGVWMSLDPREYVDRFVLCEGYYESEVLQAILAHLPKDGVFWDIGGNIGLHAVSVAKATPAASVYAFEPNPEMAATAGLNAKLNDVPVNIIDAALDENEGTATFYLHEGNAGRGSLSNWSGNPNLRTIQVKKITGDQVVEHGIAAYPDVVKIDVEGGEQRVLRGMKNILSKSKVKAVVFEDAPQGDTPVKRLLVEARFVICELRRNERTHHALCNFVAARS